MHPFQHVEQPKHYKGPGCTHGKHAEKPASIANINMARENSGGTTYVRGSKNGSGNPAATVGASPANIVPPREPVDVELGAVKTARGF